MRWRASVEGRRKNLWSIEDALKSNHTPSLRVREFDTGLVSKIDFGGGDICRTFFGSVFQGAYFSFKRHHMHHMIFVTNQN
jgi:hypothetical protein